VIPEFLAGLLLGLFTRGWTARLVGAGLIGAIRCAELFRERRRLWKRIDESLGRKAGERKDDAVRRLMRSALEAEMRVARVPPWALYPGQFLVSAGLTLALSLLVAELRALVA